MGKQKNRHLTERSPIRLDDLDPRHDINGGKPVKHIFGILHRSAALPTKKRTHHVKPKR